MKNLITVLLMTLCVNVFAQSENQLIEKAIKQAKKGNKEKAIQLFDEALKINSNSINALYNKGYTLQSLEKFGEAIDTYSQAINIQGRDLFYVQRGYCYFRNKKYNKALEDYNFVINNNPKNTEVIMKRASVYIKLEMWDPLLKDLDNYLIDNPSDYYTRGNRANLLNKLGRHEEALEENMKLLDKMPDKKILFNNIAETLIHLGRYDEALEWINKSLDLDSEYDSGLSTRAEVYSHLNDQENACIDFTRAIELGLNREDLDSQDVLVYDELFKLCK